MWQITNSYKWTDLREKFSWIRDMDGVEQDSIHHAEGDVAIHTAMVLESLESFDDFKKLSEEVQHILRAAVLLHDVEKRSTTQHEKGRVISPGHAKKGEYTSQSILYKDHATPFKERLLISKLVRHHGLPIWIFEKKDPKKEVLRSSTFVDHTLLTLLAKADMMGRICEDQADMLYRVDLFKELSEENECFQKPFSFQDSFSRFAYFQREECAPNYKSFNDTSFEVIMMSALPGSGKDTYIQKHLADWPVVSLDDIRQELKVSPTDKSGNGKVIQLAKERARIFMRKKTSFVWNATNITKQMRTQLIDLFLIYGAYVKIVYVEVPYKTLLNQNNNRTDIVSQKVLERMIWKLEIPTVDEAHEVEYMVS